MNELISIIVPVYNAKEYLTECFYSISAQTYSKIEVIFVDDGSNDGSSELCDEFEKTDSRFKVIHKKNNGVSAARNDGIDMAKGSYITFVDADDTIDKNYISMLYEAILETGAEISGCVLKDVLSKEKYIVKDMNEAVDYAATGGKYTAHLILAEIINGSEKIRYDTDLFYGEDLLFLYRAILKSNKYCRVMKPLYGYRENEGGAVAVVWNEKWDSVLIAYERLMALLKRYDKGRFQPHIEYQQAVISLFLRRYSTGHPMDEIMQGKALKIVRDRWFYLITQNTVPGVIKLTALLFIISPDLAKGIYSLYLKKVRRRTK